jgi:hypothetical protein
MLFILHLGVHQQCKVMDANKLNQKIKDLLEIPTAYELKSV